MLKLEDYRKDKDFKLDSLTYEEIFEYFEDVVNEIKKQDHIEGFKFWPVKLRKDRCLCKMSYGEDKDLYPKIKLDMCECCIILNTYEVKLLMINNKIKEIRSPELDEALVAMMCEKFPGIDYLQKREKYFEDAELMRRTQFGWNL